MAESEVDRLLEEASRVLPPELIDAVKTKPLEEQLQLLRALVQPVDIEYGPLTPSDWAAVTSDPERFGFKPTDVQGRVAQAENVIALAAHSNTPRSNSSSSDHNNAATKESAAGSAAEGKVGGVDENRTLCGFLLATLEPLRGAGQQPAGAATKPGSSAGGEGGAGAAASAAAALRARGVGKLPRLGLELQLLGVDYEFRRQGVGAALADLLGDIAAEADAGAIWLWAARHNPGAAAFWGARGFTECSEATTTSPAGEFLLMVKQVVTSQAAAGAGSVGGSSSSKMQSRQAQSGGFGGGGKRRGKGGKARAVAARAAAGSWQQQQQQWRRPVAAAGSAVAAAAMCGHVASSAGPFSSCCRAVAAPGVARLRAAPVRAMATQVTLRCRTRPVCPGAALRV